MTAVLPLLAAAPSRTQEPDGPPAYLARGEGRTSVYVGKAVTF